MKLESDLSCHPRLSGARGRVINNSSLSARLLQNAQSSQRCRIIHLLQIVKHRVIPVSAPRPRHLEFIIETASHSRTRRNKSQSMLQILLRQAILWSDNLLIQSTVYFNWSDYDFWGCNWLINVDCLNYLRSLWASVAGGCLEMVWELCLRSAAAAKAGLWGLQTSWENSQRH